MLAEVGVPLLVAYSFSENFSTYGERCEALSVVRANAEEADRPSSLKLDSLSAPYIVWSESTA
jgi:aspartate/tyrosine/aromatic aminotransferase